MVVDIGRDQQGAAGFLLDSFAGLWSLSKVVQGVSFHFEQRHVPSVTDLFCFV